MNPNPHKIRCYVCDLKRIWKGLRHEKVARWTLIVHVIYYAHSAMGATGLHALTALACGLFLVLELFSER